MDEVEAALLPGAMQQGRHRLRALRDRAIAEGAHVLLLLWSSLEWVLLAIEVPADVVIEDAAQLIPNLMANPEALAQMQLNAARGST
ncbi:hypothetical protein D9M68_794670 [compost metagenome]